MQPSFVYNNLFINNYFSTTSGFSVCCCCGESCFGLFTGVNLNEARVSASFIAESGTRISKMVFSKVSSEKS